jgi:hypothetical protein
VALLTVAVVVFVSVPSACTCGVSGEQAILKSDLRNMMTAQELYFADSLRYADRAALLQFRATEGVEVMIDTATALGFRAHARFRAPRPGGPPLDSIGACTLWVGDSTVAPRAGTEGEPHCG